MNPPNPRSEPLLQCSAPSSPPQQENAELQLAENDGIDRKLPFIVREPLHDTPIGHGLGRLTENVGVDQISHSLSVDSDSMGTKKPFSGHAKSHWSTPSLIRDERRLRRYSPRPRRSTSNSWPASMWSRSRSSAGSTIWPFEETVVFMRCKITSYRRISKLTYGVMVGGHRIQPGGLAMGCTLSQARATRRTKSSRYFAATICSPTGRPDEVSPHGMDAAGCCVRLNGKLNGVHPVQLVWSRPEGVSRPVSNAAIGIVGVSRTSNSV